MSRSHVSAVHRNWFTSLVLFRGHLFGGFRRPIRMTGWTCCDNHTRDDCNFEAPEDSICSKWNVGTCNCELWNVDVVEKYPIRSSQTSIHKLSNHQVNKFLHKPQNGIVGGVHVYSQRQAHNFPFKRLSLTLPTTPTKSYLQETLTELILHQ